MTTYVAFLRAINLGARRQFPKVDLAAASEAAGFTGVQTHINTGNVRLETRMRSRARIEAALEEAYLADRGFAVPTIVLSAAELRAVAADADRFAPDHAGQHYVSFLKDDPTPERAAALEALSGAGERVHVGARAAHLVVGADYHTSRITNASVERAAGVATNRNLTVVRALVERWC